MHRTPLRPAHQITGIRHQVQSEPDPDWLVRPEVLRGLAAVADAGLADPHREWDALVVGEYERAFYGSQYAMVAPLLQHYGVQLWMPGGGRPGRLRLRA